mmetsp:Transcript_57671/g.113583  ORF Transcript_57671/g.113583 Transcript_57671/m.113583 type:complete len:247 (+) Transcript_57671:200-940(+)
MVSVVLFVLTLATLTDKVPVVLGSRKIEQLCFLGGKFTSYAASASYHLIDFTSYRWMRWANILDVLAIPLAEGGIIAACASASVLQPHLERISPQTFSSGLRCELALFMLAFLVNGIGVYQQFKTKVPGRADLRSATVVIYFVCSELSAYSLAVGFDRPFLYPFTSEEAEPPTPWHTLLWYGTPLFYVSAFACGAAVDEFRMKECMCLPHHYWFRGKWSLHEDFHLLLLVADIFAAASIAMFFMRE